MKGLFIALFWLGIYGQAQPSGFRLIRFSGEVRAYYDDYSLERSFPGSHSDNQEEITYEAGLRMRAEGFVVHPNFMEFKLEGNLRENRGERTLQLQSDKLNYDANSHDVSLLFFKKKPIRLEFYSNETFGINQRAFFGTMANRFERLGLRVKAKTPVLVVDLDVYRFDSQQSSLERLLRDESRDVIELKLKASKSETSDLDVSYRQTDYSEQLLGVDYDKALGQLTGRKAYGPDFRNSWFFNALYFQSQGSFETTNESVQIRNSHTLAPHLISNQSANYTSSQNSSVKSEIQNLEHSLTHELFLSLTSRLSSRWERQQTDFQDIQEQEHSLDIQYRKKIPNGYIQCRLVQGMEWKDSVSSGGFLRYEELMRFTSLDLMTIGLTGIDTETIEIWSDDHTSPFVRGLDYSVIETGGFISILRLAEGSIPQDGNVLVIFNYKNYPDFQDDRPYDSQYIELHFLNLFFVTWSRNQYHHRLDSDFTVTPLEDRTTLQTSYRMESRWAVISFTDMDTESNLVPNHMKQLQVSLRANLIRNLQTSLNYSTNQTEFPNQGFSLETDMHNLDVTWRPNGLWELQSTYRHYQYHRVLEEEDANQEREEDSLLVHVKFEFRQFQMKLAYDKLLYLYDQVERCRDRFYVRIARRF